MKVFYIGYVMPEDEYPTHPAYSFAAGRFERGLLSGLITDKNVTLDVLSIEPQPGKFPSGKFMVKKRDVDLKMPLNSSKTVPYINISFIKHAFIFLYAIKAVKKWAKENKNEEKIILSYNADVPVIQVGMHFQKKGIPYIPVLADIPFYEEIKGKGISLHGMFSTMGHKSQIKNLPKLHQAVVLNENAAIDFQIPKWLLVEGAVSSEECNKEISRQHNDSTPKILYCGALDVFHGSDKLLRLAENSPSLEFYICGRGQWEEKIKRAAEQHDNIIYCGSVSNVELNEIQSGMDLMIIPHPTDLRQLRYQFPSKLMTCMSTGIPVLMTPLPGIPEEYKKYIFISKSDSIEDLQKSVTEILAMDTVILEEKGKQARKFVVDKKNWEEQAKRILTFGGDLCKEAEKGL